MPLGRAISYSLAHLFAITAGVTPDLHISYARCTAARTQPTIVAVVELSNLPGRTPS